MLSSSKITEEMLQELHHFCTINTGTQNLAGLQLMHQALEKTFSPISDLTQTIDMRQQDFINMQGEHIQQSYGKALYCRKRPSLKRRILLCGHMDTVFSADHPFQKIEYIDSKRLKGPGVTDMKGGLIVMLYALKAFEQTDAAKQLGWDVLITADEEMGSLASQACFTSIGQQCQAVLVYEPTMDDKGIMAKNRKGNGKITLIASGHSAHAGRNIKEGRNAISYLAEIITAIHALNGKRDGVSLNVGLIHGGTSLNTVPDKAVAKIDIRIRFSEDEKWALEQLSAIQKKFQRKGYILEINSQFNRPVKRISRATERLFSRLQSVGQHQGLTIQWKDSGGCCDGNNFSQMGLAVLDTMGVRGGNIHTADEYLMIDSLLERAQLSKDLLMDLAQGQLEQIYKESPQ